MFNLRILPRPSSRLIQTPLVVARTIRPISYTSTRFARKDTQDKDDLKPEPNEYSKSGSDDAAARTSDTAFDPNTTSPEAQHDKAAGESKELGQESNPLNASPANQEISQPRPAQEGGHGGSAAESGDGPSDRSRTSGGGSPEKGKSGQKYSS